MKAEDRTYNGGEQDTCKILNECEGFVTVIDSSDENEGCNVDKEQTSNISSNEAKCDILDLSGSLMGVKRGKIDDFYELYCDHAREVGFSVRKTTTRCNDAGVVIEKYFVCSCEGSKRPSTSSSSYPFERKEKKGYITRTGCKASLRVKMKSNGVYEVVGHNTLHNHALIRKDWSHMRNCERAINTTEKTITIEDMMTQDGEFVGQAIEIGDAQTLVDTLCQQSCEDRDFFFRVKLDDAGKLCNFFWRDSMMKEDYKIYGDVVVFDTTCRTNKYDLTCAQFFGINNHCKSVMFGCAFIVDEKAESFEWLLDVFKKSMEDQSPVTLFTSQDLAIENATEKVFPGTTHRLCRWLLYQDAVSRFIELKSDKCFHDSFNKCLSGCTNEAEFESHWNSMISKNDLENHPWSKRLYDSRTKWSTAFGNDFFSFGILSSQRSESTNIAFRLNAKKTTGLTEFYTILNDTVKCWRAHESKDESQCSRATPTSILPLTAVLKHASEVYTLTIFKDFEEEFVKSISTSCKMLHCDNDVMSYNVVHEDGVTCYDVTFYAVDKLIHCSCKRFEECGLLCRHSLRVFHMHSVSEIPEFHVKRRWMKFAKKDFWEDSERGNDVIPWRHDIARKYYNLVSRAQENKEARRIIEDGYDRDSVAVDSLMTMVPSFEKSDASGSVVVDDPTRFVKQRIT